MAGGAARAADRAARVAGRTPATRPASAASLDHTLLRPEAGRDAILTLCDEAVRYGVKAVCVNGGWVPDCVSRLGRSEVDGGDGRRVSPGRRRHQGEGAEARLAVGAGAGESTW